MNKRLILVFLSVIMMSVPSYPNKPVVLNETEVSYPLGLYLEILEDKTKLLTFEDVIKPENSSKFIRSRTNVPNYGFSASAYWIRFEIENKLASNENIILELNWPLFDAIEVYISQPDNKFSVKKYGDLMPFFQRDVKHRNYLFRIPSEPGENLRIYLRVQSDDSVQIPMVLWRSKAFWENEQAAFYLFGAFFGILIIMMLFNIIVYISIQDKNYLFYVIYLFFQIFFELLYFGISYQYFWPNQSFFNQIAFPVSTSFVIIAAIVFAKYFLNLHKNSPLFNKLYLGVVFLLLLSAFLALFNEARLSLLLTNLFASIGVPLIIISSIYVYKKGYKAARFFFTAWIAMLAGVSLMVGKNMGLLPFNIITSYSAHLGMILEVLLLSFALLDRFNLAQNEKRDIQRKALDLQIKVSKAQTEALEIQKEAAATLERNVLERTRELAEANEKLQELDRIKMKFFANISHEIRTPLTMIYTPIDSLLYQNSDIVADKTFFESLHRNTSKLLNLINNLLDFSKLDAGRMNMKIYKINAVDFIKNQISMASSICDSKKIKLQFVYESDSVEIYADIEMLEKITSNIFSNAVKYTDPGGEIILRVKGNESECIIECEDTGIGIPPDKLDSIFERFSQIDSDSTRKYYGTGIGLALVKEYMEMHSGRITVESRFKKNNPDNHGSVFRLILPGGAKHFEGREGVELNEKIYHEIIPADTVKLLKNKNSQKLKPALENSDDSREKILIVEDNPDMHRLLIDLLGNDYRTVSVYNGAEAVAYLNKTDEPPDLVLADVMMPEMDGYEMTEKIRENPDYESVPVILLTARSDVSMKIEGLEKGAADYIVKPFNAGELKARIRAQLDMKRLRDKLESLNRNLYVQLEEKIKSSEHVSVSGEAERKIEQVIEFINENYTTDISREGLSAAIDMHHDNLSRNFKKVTGKRLDEYINHLRIEEAKKQLAETENSVISISFNTGFENIRTFNSIFKKVTSQTPSEYRLNNRK